MMQKGELREQRFHTGTVELNYAEGPVSGEALLYLHGGDGRWQEGRALLEELASAFQVYGLDLRGRSSARTRTGRSSEKWLQRVLPYPARSIQMSRCVYRWPSSATSAGG